MGIFKTHRGSVEGDGGVVVHLEGVVSLDFWVERELIVHGFPVQL